MAAASDALHNLEAAIRSALDKLSYQQRAVEEETKRLSIAFIWICLLTAAVKPTLRIGLTGRQLQASTWWGRDA